MIHVMAVDLSLTHSGIAVTGAHGGPVCLSWVPKFKGTPRLEEIRRYTEETIAQYQPDVAIMEGSVFRSQQAYGMGQGGGVFRLCLRDNGIPLVEAPPATLKFFVLGKGIGDKNEIIAAAIRTLGFEGHDDNEADALVLWHLAQYTLGQSTLGHTVPRDRAVKKLELDAWGEVMSR